MVIKFTAYLFTHSNAILTDALESIVNVVAGAFALYSLILASWPKDENHPYGHGKIEFISASIEGILITIAGVLIIGKSIYNFFYPEEISQLDIGIILTAFCGLVNYGLGYVTEKKGEKYSSLTMIASGKHLKSDAYTTIGLIIGLAALYIFKFLWIDSIVAICFGLWICKTGYEVLRKSIAGIMDETDYELLENIVSIFNENRKDVWIDMHNMRIIKFGHVIHIDCHITIPWYFTVLRAHEEIKEVEELINRKIESPVELFIHIDPCLASSCKICQIKDCHVRQSPFENRVEWNLKNVLPNKKHSV
jgi:cation diffusion facilitator family transporter